MCFTSFFFSSRRRHTRWPRDWSSDVCSSDLGKRTGVYVDTEGKIYAVDTTCTHLGCEVEWNSAERSWDCPCHGSRFNYSGEVINGPAKEALKRIKYE